ncbi:MAG: hypothetical protein AUK34_04450 [Ignavibacteria bacterium CG2_30_36_16]|nr:MAG: hypothetical protein AUK34_04450 [Ignavibacteria bacterium CG2_30_36_16]
MKGCPLANPLANGKQSDSFVEIASLAKWDKLLKSNTAVLIILGTKISIYFLHPQKGRVIFFFRDSCIP